MSLISDGLTLTNMTFLDQLKETLESGDPIVRNWAMVHTNFLPFLYSILYIVFVKKIGPALMKDKKPFDLRYVMIAYNFALVTIYFICVSLLIYYLFTTDALHKICHPSEIKRFHYTYYAASAGWIIYILKYVEYADTIFFVLRKKNHLITNLHVIHHALLPLIGWFLFRSERSGFQFVPGVVNSVLHILMYTYYGLAAIGPEVQKHLWWKQHLTKLQMLQFIVIILFVTVILPITGCKTTKHGIYIDMFCALVFLSLFINFYSKTYKKSSTKGEDSPATKLKSKPLKAE